MIDLEDFTPHPDVSRAKTLPARWYVDPAFEALEAERIFARTWQYVGHAGRLTEPGSYFTTEVAGEPVVVLRDEAGTLRAMSNVCRHRARTVAEGEGRCKILQCKYHGFTYALDGRLIATPDFEGVQDWRREDFTLPALRLEAWGPLLFVNLDADAPPLAAVLDTFPAEVAASGTPFDAMQLVERREYQVKCNWKVFVDNYQEGYHVPVAHPGLLRELDFAKYRIEPRPYATLQASPYRKETGGERRYAGVDAEAEALYYWLFPTFMVNVYPDNMDVNVVIPQGPDHTLVVIEWYAPDPAAFRPRFLEQGLAFSEQVQDEDMIICEAVQKGLRSRFYSQGRYSPKQEPAVHRFHQLIHAFLTTPPGTAYPRV